MTATVISPVECGILAIKKTLKTLQIGLYSIFLNMSIKCIQEKEKEKDLILKKKKILLSQLHFSATLKTIDNDFLYQLCFLS